MMRMWTSLGCLLAIASMLGCGNPDFTFHDACDPRLVPDADCYAERREPGSADVAMATSIALSYIESHPPSELAWDWEEGVLMYGMIELYRVTREPRLRAYFEEWIDFHIANGYAINWSDSCPPALAAIALYEDTGDEKYADVVHEVLRFLDQDAKRTEEGGISHLGPLNVITLWVDSLFMFGMVYNRWGELTDDSDHLDTMGEQLAIFADRLQDDDGLFLHSYNWPEETDSDIFWARGNSWVTVSTADYLRARVLRHESDGRAERILEAQTKRILATQDASGAWWTLLNRPGEIYLETSATALFAYGLARSYRYGFAGDEVLPAIERAVAYVREMVTEDGAGQFHVGGISGPTTTGTYETYAGVSLGEDFPYGVGAAILALIESSGLPPSP